MKALLELHLLQNFAPSNLNRDDTGSPKDAYFGGVRRGRISSQSLKRAMRMYFKEELPKLTPKTVLAKRSKRFLDDLAKRVVRLREPNLISEINNADDFDISNTDAAWVSEAVLTLNGIYFVETPKANNQASYESREVKSEALAFLGNQMLDELAQILVDNWETSLRAGQILREFRTGKRNDSRYNGKVGKGDKKDLRKEVEKAFGDLEKQITKLIDGYKAVDIALFGRMLADLPEKNQYAACQVAHAISTHKVEHNEDFYTAVDDLKPDDNAGADMLGTVEFNSACYYRYAVIDLEKLRSNLQGDGELAVKGLEAFLRASIYALPSGKQNSFAAHQLPHFIGFTVRTDASPRSLANAFEKPIRVSQDGWLNASASALVKEWNELEAVFGQGGSHKVINRTQAKLEDKLENTAVADVEALVAQTLEQVKQALKLGA